MEHVHARKAGSNDNGVEVFSKRGHFTWERNAGQRLS